MQRSGLAVDAPGERGPVRQYECSPSRTLPRNVQ